MIVAQVGCLHGEMDKMYDKLREWEHANGQEIDVVLCCGDFQSLRDAGDLDALKCPAKFKRLGGFARYFSREKKAPFLTIFVGGNHEASTLLRDLYYGGYVAENIFFLGYSSVINVRKGEHVLRIGGISGIEKSHDARRGYFEEWPYTHREKNLTSMYHMRDFEVSKLASVGGPIDLFLSHEWPTLATSRKEYQRDPGFQQLLRYKPYFKQEIQRGELGSPLLSRLVEAVPPRVLWCSAHLHCQYRIAMPLAGNASNGRTVQFQSLDKPEGNKRFCDVFRVVFDSESGVPRECRDGLTACSSLGGQRGQNQRQPYQQREQMVYRPKSDQEPAQAQAEASQEVPEECKDQPKGFPKVVLTYDPEWIAVLQLAQDQIPLSFNAPQYAPQLISQEKVVAKMASNELSQDDLQVSFDPATTYNRSYSRVHPHTRLFLDKFGLDDRLFQPRQNVAYQPNERGLESGQKRTFGQSQSQNEQANGNNESGSKVPKIEGQEQVQSAAAASKDNNEIDLDLDDL